MADMKVRDVIWKFELKLRDIADTVTVDMPASPIPLSVAVVNGVLCVYARVDPAAPKRPRLFRIAGTGHPLDLPAVATYVGTGVLEGGRLVLHVFDLGPA